MMSNARGNSLAPRAAVIGVALVALLLGSCASTFDALPEKLGGLPETAPKRSTEQMPYPNVYEVRPTRSVAPLDDAEQKKIESELTALREGQKQRATAPDEPPPPPPPPPPAAQLKKAAAVKKPPETKRPPEPKKPLELKQQPN